MVKAIGFAPFNSCINSSYLWSQYPVAYKNFRIESCSRVFVNQIREKKLKFILPVRSKARELERVLTTVDEDEMSEGFFEAIEELERMTREPSDVLEEMNDRLSARELQLVLVYFSQEGMDS